jgi:hypothetical protein
MNERIKELAEQVGFENGHQDRNGNSLSYELAKFAELIVRECIDTINATAQQVRDSIKEHFGVEE